MRTLMLLLIVALGATALAQPLVVVPVDAPERLLPHWTGAPEVPAAQSISDTPPPALERAPADARQDCDEAPLCWLAHRRAKTVEPAWREHFLVSRRNTKYKEA